MADLHHEWPADGSPQGDIQYAPDGDLLLAYGDTETRQRIVRRWLTNPRSRAQDGTVLPSDDLFNPNHGQGLRRQVGGAITPARVDATKQLCRDGMCQEEGVSVNPPPDVFLQSPAPGVLSIYGVFVGAASQKPTATPKITLS